MKTGLPARLQALFDTATLPALGPQRRPEALSSGSVRAAVDQAAQTLLLEEPAREFVLGAALLWHDHLEESHAISQGIHSADGSWLHGIMHRREPDYGNARYWFNRVGQHPVFAPLAAAVSALERPVPDVPAIKLVSAGAWRPFAFIDACESVAGRPAMDPVVHHLQQVQQAEFFCLLAHRVGETLSDRL